MEFPAKYCVVFLLLLNKKFYYLPPPYMKAKIKPYDLSQSIIKNIKDTKY